jgi:hypothetical protein
MAMNFNIALRSGLRQLYVTVAGVLLFGALDLIFALPAPTESAWYWVLLGMCLSAAKANEKWIRGKLTEWWEARCAK